MFFVIVLVVLLNETNHQTKSLAAVPLPQGQDLAVLETPTEGASVQGQVQVIGSADHPAFEFYVIDVAPVGTEAWQFLGDGRTAVLSGRLATWDTVTLPDGSYSLRLRVVRVDGNYSESFIRQVQVSNIAPIATNTPSITQSTTLPTVNSPQLPDLPEIATFTPIPPTPTPTVLVDQPIVDTPTPRPTETATVSALPNPEEPTSLIPEIRNFSVTPLWDAFLFGAGVMLSIFLLFGFLSIIRYIILGFVQKRRRKLRN